MAFWIREIAGWVLVLLGLALFLYCLAFLGEGLVIEGAIVAGMGVVVFRGGIHLIRVAAAARVVLADQGARPPGPEDGSSQRAKG